MTLSQLTAADWMWIAPVLAVFILPVALVWLVFLIAVLRRVARRAK